MANSSRILTKNDKCSPRTRNTKKRVAETGCPAGDNISGPLRAAEGEAGPPNGDAPSAALDSLPPLPDHDRTTDGPIADASATELVSRYRTRSSSQEVSCLVNQSRRGDSNPEPTAYKTLSLR